MKLKAFTIIELIVALLIGSIVVLSASFLLISISKQSNTFRIRQNHELQYDKLIYLLEKDMDNCSKVQINGNTINFLKNDSTISEYTILSDKIRRNTTLKKNEFALSGEIISKEILINASGFTSLEIMIDGKNYHLLKQFAATELMTKVN